MSSPTIHPHFSDIETFLQVHGLSHRPANTGDSERLIASLHTAAGLNGQTPPENNFMMRLPGSNDMILHIIRDTDQTKTALYSLQEGYKVEINKKNGIYQRPQTAPLTHSDRYDLKRIDFNSSRDVIMHVPYLTQKVTIYSKNNTL